MGVDTTISLPAGVQVKDVAKAVALLLGKERKWYDCDDKQHHDEPTSNGWVEVPGITFQQSTTPECCTFSIAGQDQLLGGGWWFFYHFEHTDGQRWMSGGSRAERIALHAALARIFGGKVDFNDCDLRSVDYRKPAPRWVGKSNSDKLFHELQLALWNIKPLTQKDVDKYEASAAYKKDR